MNPFLNSWQRSLRTACLGALVLAGLAACSSGPKKPQPAELPPVAALMGTRVAWTAQIGPGTESMTPAVASGRVFVASTSGTVAALDGVTGQDVWRSNLGTPIAAGVGSDGQTAAVVTRENQLVAMAQRSRSLARASAGPRVHGAAGGGARVFVLTADRTVTAFDGTNGARLWTQTRPGEPLVLRQSGVLLAVGDTLVAGLSGRLVGPQSCQWLRALGGAGGHVARHQRSGAAGGPGRPGEPDRRQRVRASLLGGRGLCGYQPRDGGVVTRCAGHHRCSR